MVFFPFLRVCNAFRRWEKCLKFPLSVSSSYSKRNQLWTTCFSLLICGSFIFTSFLFVTSTCKIFPFLCDYLIVLFSHGYCFLEKLQSLNIVASLQVNSCFNFAHFLPECEYSLVTSHCPLGAISA